MTGLVVRGISKRFRGLQAVKNVSFDVPEGGLIGLIGPNGAGKTTTFNLIAGVFAPDGGEISFGGQRLNGMRPDQVCAAGVARTFQIVRPFAGLTVEENVMIGCLHADPDISEARAHSRRILEKLGMAGKSQMLAASLTLPDRKRLEVARALGTRPRLLLLDEVMAGLRPTEVDQMVEFFRWVNREHQVTILLIEHVMRAVMALAQYVVVLNHGEKIAEGTPEQVVRDPAVLECYLGEEAV